MKPSSGKTLLAVAIFLASALSGTASGADRVRISNGVIEGIGAQKSGVRIFKGIPFAQPPTGVLREQPYLSGPAQSSSRPIVVVNAVTPISRVGPPILMP